MKARRGTGPNVSHRLWWALTASAALAAALGLGWWMWPSLRGAESPTGVALGALPRGVAPSDLNVIVVTLDTTRADKLGCYGDPSRATPNLDRLATEGVLFEQAIAPTPLTLPAHSTIFTGTTPLRHGVRDNGGYTLEPNAETLAETLESHGYATGAFVGAYVLDSRWGLNQGFDRYFDNFDLSKYTSIGLGDVSRIGSEVVDAALPWLDQHAGQRFFAWLHFYDPHSPYEAPEPWRSRFARRPYLGEIAYMDEQVGRLLAWIDARGLAPRTLVVALGDHGESLAEHGEGTHGLFIYDATLRVPLIVRAPYAGLAGRRVPGVVRSEDVMPTILDLVGIAPPRAVQGRSLASLLTGAATDLNLDGYAESYYARNHYGWSELKAIRAGRYKYIEAPRPELYDLEQDAGELHNLYAERRPLADRLAGELRRIVSAGDAMSPKSAPGSVDPETRERLAALGYIGSFTNVAAKPGERLADPKDKIDLFNMLLAARESTGPDAGRMSIETLEKVVAADPEIMDAWMMLGNQFARQGEPERALPYYRKALDLKPDYDLATINMAHAYRQMGRFDAAIAGYERYLQIDPRNGYVHYQIGELFMDTDRIDEAVSHFRKAIELDGRLAQAQNALGVASLRRGDFASAEREIRAALAARPDVGLAHYNLALIAEQRGDLAGAMAEYQREVELHGDAYKAAFNMGRLHERLGNREAQLGAYRRAIEMNPLFAEGHFFLAQLLAELKRDPDEAARVARRGLELAPTSEYAPLGHYVLADLLNDQRRFDEARREAAAGRALEARLRTARPRRVVH